jgi:hypothetical protein
MCEARVSSWRCRRRAARAEDHVLGVDRGTAEEFHGRLLSSSHALDRAARIHAQSGSVVAAIASACGADITLLQAMLWERILIASRAPQRQYFQAAGSLLASMESAELPAPPDDTAEQYLVVARENLVTQFDEPLQREAAAKLPDLTYLRWLAAPTPDDFDAAVAARLDGGSSAAFISARRKAARESMVEAQSDRIRGRIPAAIQAAYVSDFQSLEAYLIESALATGDARLLSVTMRSDLVASAIAELPRLPEDFGRAVGTIRDAMCSALTEADAERLRDALLPV